MSITPHTSPPPDGRPQGAPWAVRDAAAFLGISTRHLLRLIDGRRVKSILLGRRRLIPDEEVQRLARAGC